MGPHVSAFLQYALIGAVGAGLIALGKNTKSVFLGPVLVIFGGAVALVGGFGCVVNLLALFGL